MDSVKGRALSPIIALALKTCNIQFDLLIELSVGACNNSLGGDHYTEAGRTWQPKLQEWSPLLQA